MHQHLGLPFFQAHCHFYCCIFDIGCRCSRTSPKPHQAEYRGHRACHGFGAPSPGQRRNSIRAESKAALRINHASMVFKLSPAQQADLAKLLAEQQDSRSPNYRKWLTPEQYAARFGMSDSDLAQVSSWLKSQGLTVDGFSRGRTQVFFSGSASQVESAFHTQFNRYLVDGQTSIANAVEISVPEAIAGMVQGFRGFENFRPQPRVHAVKPNFTSHQTGNHFIAPGDFATIYNVPAALDGTGQTIAVVGQTEINFSDVDAFRTAAGLPARTTGASANFQQILITGGGSGFNDGDEVEANLDVEWIKRRRQKSDHPLCVRRGELDHQERIRCACSSRSTIIWRR